MKQIKISLADPDLDRFRAVADDMNIDTDSILAKKFVLDAIKSYEKSHPDMYRERNANAARFEQQELDIKNGVAA